MKLSWHGQRDANLKRAQQQFDDALPGRGDAKPVAKDEPKIKQISDPFSIGIGGDEEEMVKFHEQMEAEEEEPPPALGSSPPVEQIWVGRLGLAQEQPALQLF